MDIKSRAGNILKEKSDAAVIAVFEGEPLSGALAQADKAMGGAMSRAVKQGEFTGKRDETILFRDVRGLDGGPERLLVVGLASVKNPSRTTSCAHPGCPCPRSVGWG